VPNVINGLIAVFLPIVQRMHSRNVGIKKRSAAAMKGVKVALERGLAAQGESSAPKPAAQAACSGSIACKHPFRAAGDIFFS